MPYTNNNERLEFLGDSVLNMLTTEYLYRHNDGNGHTISLKRSGMRTMSLSPSMPGLFQA